MSFRKISTSNLASTTTVFDDPIIVINNKGTVDNQDVGILAKTTANAYTGLFRDGTTKDYYLVEQYVQTISNNDLVPGQATLSDLHLAHLTASGITMSGSIIPDTNIAYDLGSPTNQWRDIYVGPGSLYVNGQKVLEDNSGTITVQADTDQALTIKTSGTGVLTLQSATTINVASTLQLATGVSITSADGGAVKLGDKLDANNNQIINVATPTMAMHAANKNYVDSLFNTLINGAPGVLDTLNELANAIGDDPAFITTINTSLATKADKTYVDQQIAGITVTTDLASLTDVTLTTPTDGQVLVYDSVNSIWVNSDAPQGFDGQYSSLTGIPTIPADVSDLTDTTGLLTHFDGAYSSLTGLPTLFSGSYTDLTNKPTLFDGQYTSLTGTPTIPADVSQLTDTTGLLSHFDGDYNSLTNKPTIPTVPTTVSSFTNDAGYLTSYTETDPIFTAHVASGITSSNITQWNSAYLWGNHATQGYLTSYTDTNNYLSGLSFNTGTGVLTATRSGLADLTVDLDGRYLQSFTETPDVVTSLSHNPTTKILSYVDETGTTTNIDLTNYLDDTNLARIASGSMDSNGIATFTRDDATTFTVDMSILLDDTNLPRIVSAGWNTSNGVLTLTRNDATTVSADLDGRYLQSYTETDTLASVTARGATTSTNLTLNGTVSTNNHILFNANGYSIQFNSDGDRDTLVWLRNGVRYWDIGHLTDPKVLNFRPTNGASNNVQINGNRILTTADEGSGNGLDADTLDGLHASSFLQSYTETDTLASVTARGATTATAVTFSGGITGALTGNASTASKWQTSRTLTLAGDATGSVSIDGSANATLTVAVANDSHTHSTYVNNNGNGNQMAVVDSRSTATTPQTINRGVAFDFKQNTTEGLSDGGTYFGEMTFRQYGSSTDWSGGKSHQLGFTDNDNVWHRSGTSTTWGSWQKLWHSGNDGAGSGLDADTLDGQHASSFASASHSHSYLPLTGGTVTGRTTINVSGRGNEYTTSNLELYTGDNTPPGISFHRGGYSATNLRESGGQLYIDPWNTQAAGMIWHQGNDGAGSGLDADLLDGQHASAFASASHTHTTIHQSTDPASTTYRLLLGNGTNAQGAVYNFSDLYWNDTTSTIVGANINGNANYATTAGSANNIDGIGFRNGNSTNGTAPNNVSENGVGYTVDSASLTPLYGYSDGALYSQAYNTTWVHQIYGDYRTGRVATRGKNSGTWQAWNEIAVQPTVASTAPSSPQQGDFWWDDTEGLLNIYYAGAWVEASPAAASIAQGTGSGLDADKVDGYEGSELYRTVATASATVGPGWVTIGTCTSARHHNEFIVSDAESSDHSFIRIDWMRSYADNNFSVLNVGGHSNRITGVRVLYTTADITYGTAKLQIYVTTSSAYHVRMNATGTHGAGWSDHTIVTPVLENTITGYAVHGNELTGLDAVSMACEEGFKCGGSIVAGGDVTAYSDRRFKHDIETITGALDKVNAMRGTSFTMNNKKNVGVIAQEMEEVVPEVVHTDSEGMKSVAYGNLAGVFIEAMKEMDAKYSAKIAELEAQIEEMKRNG